MRCESERRRAAFGQRVPRAWIGGALCAALAGCSGAREGAEDGLADAGAGAVGEAAGAGGTDPRGTGGATDAGEPGAGGGVARGGATAASGAAGASSTPPDPSAADVFCPSLGLEPESLLFASTRIAAEGSPAEYQLIRADGSVFLQYVTAVPNATFTAFPDGAGMLVVAWRYGLEAGLTEREWEIARFDADGVQVDTVAGATPVPADVASSIYPPSLRREGNSIVFDFSNGDSWFAELDGSAVLHECERRTPIAAAEEDGWTAVWVELGDYGAQQGAFVQDGGGACRRIANDSSSGDSSRFQHGRFQYLRNDSNTPVLTDEGPSSSVSFSLSPRGGETVYSSLYSLSADVLYVIAAPELARYDVVAQEFRLVELPAPAMSFGLYGDHVVGYDAGLPLWSYDLVAETSVEFGLTAPEGSVRIHGNGNFLLLAVDQRPTTWIEIASGESWPFELEIPAEASVEIQTSGASALLLADHLPIAQIDLEAGVASAIELPRTGESVERFHEGDTLLVVLDGVPSFRVAFADGAIEEIEGGLEPVGETSTLWTGYGFLVSSDGRPRALLESGSSELLPIDGADEMTAAATGFVASERYVVGFDARSWPVYRLDVESRALETYGVAGPSELVGFLDELYVLEPGDLLYDEFYAPEHPNAQVLEDGTVAVALRDDRQGRLWLVTPEDSEFRPIGNPVRDVSGIRWSTQEYFVQIAGTDGDCYCVPPRLRWDDGADANVLAGPSVQLVAWAHPENAILRRDYQVVSLGACLIDPVSPVPAIVDLLEGSSRSLEAADGNVSFFASPGQ